MRIKWSLTQSPHNGSKDETFAKRLCRKMWKMLREKQKGVW